MKPRLLIVVIFASMFHKTDLGSASIRAARTAGTGGTGTTHCPQACSGLGWRGT